MGVTLQVYRCRIGTFQSRKIKYNGTNTSAAGISFKVTKVRMFSMLLFIVSLMVASQLDINIQETRYSPKQTTASYQNYHFNNPSTL